MEGESQKASQSQLEQSKQKVSGELPDSSNGNNDVRLNSGDSVQNNKVIKVRDMDPNYLYKTTGKSKMPCRVLMKPDPLQEETELHYFEGRYNRCWMTAMISLDYPVTCTNIEISSKEISINTRHKANGPGMLEMWGITFNKYIDKPGGRDLIIKEMSITFPDKKERILKWVDAYKSYYNSGRLPGCVKQDTKKQWIPAIGEDPLRQLIKER